MGEKVRNMKVKLRDWVIGSPKESDMCVSSEDTIELEVPQGSNGILVKHLYLSCDPCLQFLMKGTYSGSFPPHSPGQVCLSPHPHPPPPPPPYIYRCSVHFS